MKVPLDLGLLFAGGPTVNRALEDVQVRLGY
jgi:hypothetical protein